MSDVERAKQHVVSAEGERLLRGYLQPRGWVVRKVEQSEDYGIDFEVEVFSDEGDHFRSTGFIFKVQLKSSGKSRYLKSDSCVCSEIKKKHLAYYLNELKVPVIVIHADVNGKRLFWAAPQFDEQLRRLADPQSEAKVTLRIRTANELPTSIERMLRDVNRVATMIATRTVVSAPIPEFLSGLRSDVAGEALARDLRDRSDAVRLHELQRLFLARAYDKGEEVINQVLSDKQSSIQNKFWALLEQERITTRKLFDARSPQSHRPDATLAIARKLQTLTRSGPPELKLAALMTRVAAQLDVLTHRAFGLFMNCRTHQESGLEMWRVYAALEKARTEQLLRRKYNQAVRLARYAMNSKYRNSLPAALVRIVQGVPPYLIVLDREGRKNEALQYRQSGFQVLQLAAWIAHRIGEHNVVKFAASLAVQISKEDFTDPSDWAHQTIKKIDDSEERFDAEQLLSRAQARKDGIDQEGDILTTHQQIYENMATSLGIPLEEPSHPLTRMFYAGVKDSDPTRALRHCEHSFVSLTQISLLAHTLGQQLGLPIGPKLMECSKHGYIYRAGSLDDAYQGFNTRFCQSCPDRRPHPEGWEYTPEWHEQQHQTVLKAREARETGRAPDA
ncbi:MAG TPA: DUF4365 domain-containing protein [Candidatus Dormibacteraeota bacterium]|nr:DUF4365 domain-containing protein [Candidatus Dormibacteraeota bacterium]